MSESGDSSYQSSNSWPTPGVTPTAPTYAGQYATEQEKFSGISEAGYYVQSARTSRNDAFSFPYYGPGTPYSTYPSCYPGWPQTSPHYYQDQNFQSPHSAVSSGIPSYMTPPASESSSRLSSSSEDDVNRPSSDGHRRHVCDNCARVFKRKADLQRHISAVHREDTARMYYCDVRVCERSEQGADGGFTRKDHLVDHLRNFHHRDIPKRRRAVYSNLYPTVNETKPSSYDDRNKEGEFSSPPRAYLTEDVHSIELDGSEQGTTVTADTASRHLATKASQNLVASKILPIRTNMSVMSFEELLRWDDEDQKLEQFQFADIAESKELEQTALESDRVGFEEKLHKKQVQASSDIANPSTSPTHTPHINSKDMEAGDLSRSQELATKQEGCSFPEDSKFNQMKGAAVLEDWWQKHKKFPYPCRTERKELSMESGLSMDHIRTWLTNRRALEKGLNASYESHVTYPDGAESTYSARTSPSGSQNVTMSEHSYSDTGSPPWSDYLESDTESFSEGYHILDSVKPLLAIRLLEQYQAFKSCTTNDAGQASGSHSAPNSVAGNDEQIPRAGQRNGRKRGRGREPPCDGDGAPDGKPNKTPRNCKVPEDSRLLACPFYKKDPRRYRCCNLYILREISRVKQHLVRRHQIPIHCDSCQVEFETEDERAIHCRLRPPCEVLPEKDWDGITEAQKTLLAARVSARKSREENWYITFSILFPSAPKPRSPYLDPDFADGLLALREFAAIEMPNIVAEVISERSLQVSLPSDFDVNAYTEVVVRDAIDILLARFESRMPPEPSNSSAAPNSNSSDSGYSSSSSRVILNTQSGRDSFDPILPLLSEDPLEALFAGFERDRVDPWETGAVF